MKIKVKSNYLFIIFVIYSCLLFAGCSDKNDDKTLPKTSTEASEGFLIVKENCKVCHAQGINGAPIIGNKKMWAPRLNKGIDNLAQNAASGIGLMPPKGGKTDLSDEQIRTAVSYMLEQVTE